ncbi:M23 family metallopeptidase [Sanguibacter sp. YZGR15]|uniref:M23 family metallopeptidase n=2 Tax=Sanguibacter suaedae TaxID=2795737 RepID=A0A934ICR0_9MICO|nr:M23 family metallopeptidase [Sanguibacter suaedae]
MSDLRASGLLVAPFEAPAERWSPGHRGVDLAHPSGADVLAPQDGVVSYVGFVVDRPLLVITHPDGLRSTLEPVETRLTPGSTVVQGDVVGTTSPGIAHCPPRTCVHWGVRRGDEYVDPLTLLGLVEPVVLLPDR